MSKQVVVQFTYPSAEASSFNMEYYVNKHIPLIEKLWGPQGVVSWIVATGDKDAGYHVQATLVWESIEAFENLTKVEEVVGDGKNFTDVAPTRTVGFLVGQGTVVK